MAGATHEALLQIIPKAIGLNIGGEDWPGPGGESMSVWRSFVWSGCSHLNEVAGGLGTPGD